MEIPGTPGHLRVRLPKLNQKKGRKRLIQRIATSQAVKKSLLNLSPLKKSYCHPRQKI